MASEASDLALEEYRALRATIRERGTARVVVTTITFVSWAALTVTVWALALLPLLGLAPLIVLAAGFESAFALHVGVERIGRFLQARYETPGALPGWEHAAMTLGNAPALNPRIDALYLWPFLLATVLNLFVVLLLNGEDPPLYDVAAYSLVHAALVVRVGSARRFARGQRDRDLAHFKG
jgi:hypothetical protein